MYTYPFYILVLWLSLGVMPPYSLKQPNSFPVATFLHWPDNHTYLPKDSIYFPGSSDGIASAYNAGDLGSIPGLGRSPGEGNGNPLQYSCLENPMD